MTGSGGWGGARAGLTPRRVLVTASVAIGWLALVAYGVVSARAAADAPLTAMESVVNAGLLGIELLLGAFGLLLFGALATPPRAAPPTPVDGPRPPVTLVIPVFGESANVLAETLRGVRRLAWPRDRLDVVVVDDTRAAAVADALRATAEDAGVRYVRRRARRGFKAGALNDVIRGSDAPVVAVLDVDHVPERDWLARTVPVLLADPRTAYVQGRLAWRNLDAPLRRLQGLLQAHFYEIIQRAKAERGVAVFAGSGAVFRREALDAVGGFPEDTLVEDFDLTVTCLNAGWRGAFVPVVVARGLVPWTSADVARQLWRWAHGTTRVVVKQAPRVLRGSRASWRTRLECLADGTAYTGAGLFVLAGALLAFAAATGTPLPRPGGKLALLGPGLVLAAHSVTAAVALRRAGERGFRWIVPYHVVSLAFTPVVCAASLAALLNRGAGAEGRVAKEMGLARAKRTGGLGMAAVVAGVLGVGLLASAAVLRADGWASWLWAGELGVAFVTPFLLGVVETRGDT